MKFKNYASAPANPPAGYVGLYAIADVLYWIDSSGVSTSIASGTGDLKADGTIPLTANWDVGAFKITALQLESDVVTGTPPLIVASTTVVPNLNADKVDGADLIDEDNMVSNSAVHVPTQQSVKAYVDSSVVGLFDDKGNYDAATNTPDLDTAPSGILKGDVYTVSVAGTFFTASVEVGDVLRALQDSPTTLAHWAIVQTNLDAPSVKTLYESNADTNAYDDAAAAVVAAAITSPEFSDADLRVKDNTDATKKLAFEVSGITTGTTRTITVPDANVDLGDIATNTAAIAANTSDIAAPIHTLHVETVADQDYVLTFDAPYAGTITTLRTKTESGTCTVTGYINAVALGGTANSASSTAQEQAHASANTYAKGDEIKVTVTSNSAGVDLEVTFYGTRSDL